eukprot:TRINITY_DN6957_c1_g1_i1.p3 TRINITY_DN6957_c1_g1~~TRINITY_DN6957_c1_g1_i1.p3  ORF type:complete len:130 (-),score=25.32 TRINITY_DN6957_c1_g1_i1:1477-1866(-)
MGGSSAKKLRRREQRKTAKVRKWEKKQVSLRKPGTRITSNDEVERILDHLNFSKLEVAADEWEDIEEECEQEPEAVEEGTNQGKRPLKRRVRLQKAKQRERAQALADLLEERLKKQGSKTDQRKALRKR